MPKYYVECATFQEVLAADTKEIAATKACVKHSDKPRPDVVHVNEQGFKMSHTNSVMSTDSMIDTKDLFND